jgi:hypothetical protein
MQPQPERRTNRRFPLTLPVLAKCAGGEVLTQTRDISSRGICFFASHEFPVGSTLEFVLTLPAEMTLTEPIRISCTGRVVRVESKEDGTPAAIAAVIDDYEFLVSGAGRWTTRPV